MPRKKSASLLIATPSPLMQRGLAHMVDALQEVNLVGRTQDALATFTMIESLQPDVLLLESSIACELKALSAVKRHQPRVLVLASQRHVGVDPPCGDDCACGFIRDRAPVEHLRTLLRVLANCEGSLGDSPRCDRCPARSSLRLPRLPLSRREAEIFERIGRGEGNNTIAAGLGVSVKTVETHRENIKRKLGLESAYELLRTAVLWHLGYYAPEDDGLPPSKPGSRAGGR